MSEFQLKSRDFLHAPEQKREFNRQLFSAIAPEYAGMSRTLSFGRDAAWKRRLIDELPPMSTPNCLDLACGNGDLSALLLEKYPDAAVTALDLAGPMLNLARRRLAGRHGIRFLKLDMTDTGLPDSEFDIITVGYGLRNAPDLDLALAEISRLLRHGGSLALLDFSRYDDKWCATAELKLLRMWCGMWGLIRSGNADTYGYIADSLARFPARSRLHSILKQRGFSITRSRRYCLGIVERITGFKRS